MRIKSLISIILLLMAVLTMQATLSQQGRRLFTQCEEIAAMRRFNELKSLGEQLRRMGQANGNIEEEAAGQAYGLYSLIQMRDTADNSAALNHLKHLIDDSNAAVTSPEIAAIVARTIAIYYQLIESDMSQGANYAFKALNNARSANHKSLEVSALSTLASLYFQKQDSTGFTYACKAYDLAKKHDLTFEMYPTSVNMANYLYNRKQFDKALKYLKEGADYAQRFDLKSEQAYLNSFFADIYQSIRQPVKAEKYHLLAINDTVAPVYDYLYSVVCYAMFLTQEDREQEALNMFHRAEKIMSESKADIFKPQIYYGISQNAEKTGDFSTALDYHKRYMEVTLERMNEAKEKEFAILDLRSRVAEEKSKNAEHEVELLHRRQLSYFLIVLAILLTGVIVGLFFYQRRRNSKYKEMIARYLENARAEEELRSQLNAALAELKENTPKSSGSLNEERATELFEELEKMMKEQHLYRDSSLTLTSIAQKLCTNRTYLSQVVNSKAGKSFVAYINEYRLNESVQLLMDPDNNDSLKSIGIFTGFSSPSNFYTLFKAKVGVSPSVFRNNYRKIEK